MPMPKPSKSLHVYEMQAEICAALANPIRLRILDILSQGERTNSELLEILAIPKPNLSQHLSVLKDAGIITSRKEGLFQYVSVAIPQVKDACSIIRGVLFERLSARDRMTRELKRELAIRTDGKRKS